MIIYINGEKIKVYEYDDKQSIFDRYALDKDDALPEYFASEDFKIENKAKNLVDDVRDVIKKLKESDLADEDLIDRILNKYNMRKRTIGTLWFILKDIDIKKINLEGPISYLNERGVFNTHIRTEMTVKDYKDNVKKRREILKKIVDRQLSLYKRLDKLEKVSTTPFILEDKTLSVTLSIKDTNLIEIFDSIIASPEVPFVELKYRNETYYKIYDSLEGLENVLSEWIGVEPPTDLIRFKILNTNVDPFSSKNVDKIYSTGTFIETKRNIYSIESRFKVSKTFAEDDFVKRLQDMIDKEHVEYKVMSKEAKGIRGIFKVTDFDFNTTIFADFISTNKIASKVFFLDERLQTISSKNKYYFYYNSKELRLPSESFGISVTRDQNAIQFRITRASNLHEAQVLQMIIAKMVKLYNDEYASIYDIYKNLFPSEKIGVSKKVKEEKEKKTKLRLDSLYKERPDIIRRKGYSTQCQKPAQPYIVPEDEIKDVAKKLKDPHKMIRFEGSWFACEPRDPKDPEKSKSYVWPGLKRNTKGGTQYQKEVPLLPCCFKKDQYQKPGSEWRKYYDQGEGETEKVEKKSGVGYIVGIKKMCEPGRKGEMPFLWEKIFKLMGLSKVKLGAYAKTDKDFYPILRLGMEHRPDSVVYCLEYAFNSSFRILDAENKNKKIQSIKKELSKDSFAVAKQSLYAENHKEIKKILQDDNTYVDPLKFVEILQRRYDCNIFFYGYDGDEFPDGKIMLPVHSQAYLAKEIVDERPTILIILYATKFQSYPYQCELVCQIEVKDGKEVRKNIKYLFPPESKLSRNAVKLFYDHNEVFIAGTDGYEIYTPVSL